MLFDIYRIKTELMKKTFLLFALATSAFTANAQLNLGATPYTQNFDTIGSGLPNGWLAYTSATTTSLGTIYSWSGSTNFGVWADTTSGLPAACTYCPDVFGKGFKNSASFDGSTKTDIGDVQKLNKDRAFAVKQTSFAGFNPGPAFVLHLSKTVGLSNLAISFKLQSLDYTDLAVTTWTIDYGIGTAPTAFTAVPTTGDMTTGGLTFKSNTVTANFGTALNNSFQEVWIRIVALSATTGGGNRTVTGIDDFTLTYTGAPSEVSEVTSHPALMLTVLGNASANKVPFQYSVEDNADYNFSIYDLTGRTLHTESIAAQPGTHQIAVDGLHLAPGMYFAKMSNNNSSAVTKIIVQ